MTSSARTFNAIEDASEQLEALEAYFENFANRNKELTELCSNNA